VKNILIPHRRRGFAWKLILLAAGTLAANASPTVGDAPATAIKILTFNIMWEENGVRAGNLSLPVWEDRKSPVIQLITNAAADIVGLQEASPEQQAGLRTGLPRYTLVFEAATNNTNPILFKTQRFRLLESGAFVLNTEPEIKETNIGVRSSTWVQLEDRESRKRLWVYNLHLDHRSKGPTRQISAVRLMERLKSNVGAVFVTGDFNTSESSPTMTFFYGRTALTNDLGVVVRNPMPLVDTFKFIHPESPEKPIDHVLVGTGVGIRHAGRIASGKASDHDIIWTEVSLE
jgi:endonuclease/exonuclease/phosphatase family metal-dependent hydrolase